MLCACNSLVNQIKQNNAAATPASTAPTSRTSPLLRLNVSRFASPLFYLFRHLLSQKSESAHAQFLCITQPLRLFTFDFKKCLACRSVLVLSNDFFKNVGIPYEASQLCQKYDM
jgi:hypothetical protein